ncbi:MAG: hypothetical protein C5B57_12960 [Blastocatellia bacterium]|nr:MAG: hypothetical protein C5B57_12960 [Blastocatellia bacterium]
MVATALCGAAPWLTVDRILTEDTNHDGRPDVWRAYDRFGQLTTLRVDTNFDGRSDVEEYFEHGELVRRELDRDFDDRVDLVEDFDPDTSEQTRAADDIDRDGVADVVTLFQAGRPASTQWVVRTGTKLTAEEQQVTVGPAVLGRWGDDALAPLTDLFRARSAFRRSPTAVGSNSLVALTGQRGLPRFRHVTVAHTSPAPVGSPDIQPPSLTPRRPSSPRGPPTSRS